MVGLALADGCIRRWRRPWAKAWFGASALACAAAGLVGLAFTESDAAARIAYMGAIFQAVLYYDEIKRLRGMRSRNAVASAR